MAAMGTGAGEAANAPAMADAEAATIIIAAARLAVGDRDKRTMAIRAPRAMALLDLPEPVAAADADFNRGDLARGVPAGRGSSASSPSTSTITGQLTLQELEIDATQPAAQPKPPKRAR